MNHIFSRGHDEPQGWVNKSALVKIQAGTHHCHLIQSTVPKRSVVINTVDERNPAPPGMH